MSHPLTVLHALSGNCNSAGLFGILIFKSWFAVLQQRRDSLAATAETDSCKNCKGNQDPAYEYTKW